MQKPQLHDDEKQEEALRTHGDQEVLPGVPQAYRSQGSEVNLALFAKVILDGGR
jgi:hypothetical protein